MADNAHTLKPPNRIAGDGGFKNKILLVTGVTGFIGKAFIEKILRSCPQVKKIYVLVRVKKEKDPEARMKEIFAGPVFAHISTAYCHPEEKVLCEKAYLPPADPYEMIQIVELLDEETANMAGKRLAKNSPNVYTFTKALAENLVTEEMDHLPVVIFRPSIVVSTLYDPVPGWIDNMNGPMGILVAGGKGILRTMHGNPNSYADFLPVDIAANLFMATAYDYIAYKERRIYNITTSAGVQVTWELVSGIAREIVTTTMPFNWVVWYPGGSMKTSRLYKNICIILFHYIPAIILDSLIILSRNKPVMWKIQQRITQGFELLEYYTNNQWNFDDKNAAKCRSLMNETEKEIYKYMPQNFDIKSYFYNCIHGARLYLLKESDETLPTAKRHLKIMWAVDSVCKILLLIGFGYLLLKYLLCPAVGIYF